jgi:hypothetical protein
MKTIHLNLAAHPHRDYRPVWVVVAIAGLVTAMLMVYNLQTAYRYLVETKQTRGEIQDLDDETARERAMTKSIDAALGTIDLRALDSQVKFINSKIRERAFSWSALMERLEKVVPNDVKLSDLNPTVGDDGTVGVSLTCISRKPGGMVQMLDRLLADPAFKGAFPASETIDPDGMRRFSISVTYLPDAPEVKK